MNNKDKNTAEYTWPIERVFKDRSEILDDPVVIEEPLEIVLNGHGIAVLMRMPGQEKELATGFCVSEGYVADVRDILLIHHCGSGFGGDETEPPNDVESRNRVEIRVAEGKNARSRDPDVTRLIRAGCGAADVSALSVDLPSLPDGPTVPYSLILDLGKTMRDLQPFHGMVGGTHSAALFTRGGKPLHISEDIGRHNAVDKVAGYCLLRRVPLNDKILITSGRASYEMAVKAIRLGIPVIATISAPTSLAVQLAKDMGLTLIGYLRGGRMNVYTHSRRISSKPPEE